MLTNYTGKVLEQPTRSRSEIMDAVYQSLTHRIKEDETQKKRKLPKGSQRGAGFPGESSSDIAQSIFTAWYGQ